MRCWQPRPGSGARQAEARFARALQHAQGVFLRPRIAARGRRLAGGDHVAHHEIEVAAERRLLFLQRLHAQLRIRASSSRYSKMSSKVVSYSARAAASLPCFTRSIAITRCARDLTELVLHFDALTTASVCEQLSASASVAREPSPCISRASPSSRYVAVSVVLRIMQIDGQRGAELRDRLGVFAGAQVVERE